MVEVEKSCLEGGYGFVDVPPSVTHKRCGFFDEHFYEDRDPERASVIKMFAEYRTTDIKISRNSIRINCPFFK